jgi:hypothetical protein
VNIDHKEKLTWNHCQVSFFVGYKKLGFGDRACGGAGDVDADRNGKRRFF